MKNPNIVVGVGDLLGCGYYRCSLPYRYLAEKHHINVHLTNSLSYPSKIVDEADAMVFQRQHSPQVFKLAQIAQSQGKRVIFEIDDYFHDLPVNNPARLVYRKGGPEIRKLEDFMQLADLMTVSTEPLKDAYSVYCKNIVVCPNVLANDALRPFEPTPRDSDEFRLGWAGSSTHADDWATAAKPISELMMELPHLRFVFIGQDYRNMLHHSVRGRCEYLGSTMPTLDLSTSADRVAKMFATERPVERYYDLLQQARLHTAIAPIVNMTFNRKKSQIKIVEYGLTSIPFIASAFGPYSSYFNEGFAAMKRPVGILADTNSQWKAAVRKLYQDDACRLELAQNNYDNVLARHTIGTGAERWLDALATVGIKPGDEPGHYEENLLTS